MTELQPFTTLLNLKDGAIEPQRDEVVRRRLSDMKGMYLDESGDLGNPLIYEVRYVKVPPVNSNIVTCTTAIRPGDVNGEFHMTKGHFHEIRDRSEIYVGLSGEGLLVLATEDGRYALEPMRRGTVNYIPGGWAHRSINVSDEPLVFHAAYIADAGYDYGAIEERGFPVAVMRGSKAPQVVDNPRYRS